MTTTLNELNLPYATGALQSAHKAVHETGEKLHHAKSNLAANENHCILKGLDGKNETERKAHLADLTLRDRLNVEEAERNHRAAQLHLTLAELNYRLARELNANRRAELLARAPLEAGAH